MTTTEIITVVFCYVFTFALWFVGYYFVFILPLKRAKACKHYCPDCKNKHCQFFKCLKKAHPGSYKDKFTVKYFYEDRAKEQ